MNAPRGLLTNVGIGGEMDAGRTAEQIALGRRVLIHYNAEPKVRYV